MMMRRTAGWMLTAAFLSIGMSGVAYGGRGHGGHFAGGFQRFHGDGFHRFHRFHPDGFHRFHGGGFRSRVFIGGTFLVPFYDPPAYYSAPPPQPQPSYWYYCPYSGSYYPYVQQCPGGWQLVVPYPPS